MAIEGISNVSAGVESAAPEVKVAAPVVTPEAVKPVSSTENSSENMDGNEGRPVAKSTVKETVNKTNDAMQGTRCEFSYHEKTRRVSIKVIDKDTDEVIREIPPEKSLDMLEKMWEMAGILVDEKQ